MKKSHISSHPHRENFFKYIMKSVDESESDQNVIVLGIRDSQYSWPHKINRKSYTMTFAKCSDNSYDNRLGFNLFKLVKDFRSKKKTLYVLKPITILIIFDSFNVPLPPRIFPLNQHQPFMKMQLMYMTDLSSDYNCMTNKLICRDNYM